MMDEEFHKQSRDLSDKLTATVMSPISEIVIGPQKLLARAVFESGLRMSREFDGIILVLMLGTIRMNAMTQMLEMFNRETVQPFVQLTTPILLNQRMLSDGPHFFSMLSYCRRFVVWLESTDFLDAQLMHWLKVYCEFPEDSRPGVTYLWPYTSPLNTDLLEAVHGTMNRIEEPFYKTPNNPVLFEYSVAHTDKPFELSSRFAARCQKSRTLASCRFGALRLRCEEWASIKHVPLISAQAKHEQKSQKLPSSCMYSTVSAMDEYYRTDIDFNHVAIVDPSPNTQIRDISASWCRAGQYSAETIICTSRFSLLASLAAFAEDPKGMDKIHPYPWVSQHVNIYFLYEHLLMRGHLTDNDFEHYCGEHSTLVREYWLFAGIIRKTGALYEAAAGCSELFAGVQKFSQLDILMGYHHETSCQTPDHEFCAWIDAEFLRQQVSKRFTLYGQGWGIYFFNILNNEAIVRPDTASAEDAWLDASPLLLSFKIADRMRRIIFGGLNIQNTELSTAAADAIAELRSAFEDTPADRFLEVCGHEACWWTFAGVRANSLVTLILHIFAPKLRISFGNLSIRFNWKPVNGDEDSACRRFEQLISQVELVARTGKFPAASVSAFKANLRRFHPFGWIAPILPQAYRDTVINFCQHYIKEVFTVGLPPVIKTESLHCIDELPFVFEEPSSVSGKHVSRIPDFLRDAREAVNPDKAQIMHMAPTPVRPGIMHTRYPWSYIDSNDSFQHALSVILTQPYIGLDVETTLFNQKLCLIQIGCQSRSFLIDPLRVDFSGLRQVFEHPEIPKIIHNAAFEKGVMKKYGMQINNIIDTMAVSRKIYGKIEGGHSLRAVCQREFGFDMDKTCQTSRWEIRPLTPEQLEYAALDAEIMVHLYRHFNNKFNGCIPK